MCTYVRERVVLTAKSSLGLDFESRLDVGHPTLDATASITAIASGSTGHTSGPAVDAATLTASIAAATLAPASAAAAIAASSAAAATLAAADATASE